MNPLENRNDRGMLKLKQYKPLGKEMVFYNYHSKAACKSCSIFFLKNNNNNNDKGGAFSIQFFSKLFCLNTMMKRIF